ncbi:MAG: hypothetical protein BroJett030_29550 [Alphaproteobacteria bacterium]|nr:MAG: hypothetical protein BroJett030_29550 [Alphaproteobacteria bacterium]
MNVRTLILAILNFCEASGYEIKKMSSEGSFSYFVDISYGSIYPTLARLEAEGMVAGRVESHAGKPDRRIYSITERGRAELVRGLSQPPQKDIFKSEFLLQAINAPLVGPDVMAAALAARIANLEAEIAMLDGIIADCDHPATLWVANYGKRIMTTDLHYLKAHRNDLVAIAGQAAGAPQAAE